MKKSALPPASVPRLHSLLHRLQQTPGPEDQPYLDQLMMFLAFPPPQVGDRWKKGAAMCAEWGIATSGTSVWRLYLSYGMEWRARLALQNDAARPLTPKDLAKKSAEMLALRTCELLSNPDTDSETLVRLARLALREKMLDLAREKHADSQRDETERALDALDARARRDRYSEFILREFKAALERKPSYPSLFPVAPPLREILKSPPPTGPFTMPEFPDLSFGKVKPPGEPAVNTMPATES
jgi:hypothetical protein